MQFINRTKKVQTATILGEGEDIAENALYKISAITSKNPPLAPVSRHLIRVVYNILHFTLFKLQVV